MLIGYARVSTQDQQLDLQLDALKDAKCEKIYQDVASGAKPERKGLQDALEHMRVGDTLVVWKLDRLGRSLKHLIELVNQLNARGIEFKSLRESIDTTSSSGKLIFNMFAVLAEFERDTIRERTNAGLKAARARGRIGGRKHNITDSKELERLYKLYDSKEYTVDEIVKMMPNIKSRSTVYSYLRKRNKKIMTEEASVS